jgi:hypothetical protein
MEAPPKSNGERDILQVPAEPASPLLDSHPGLPPRQPAAPLPSSFQKWRRYAPSATSAVATQHVSALLPSGASCSQIQSTAQPTSHSASVRVSWGKALC